MTMKPDKWVGYTGIPDELTEPGLALEALMGSLIEDSIAHVREMGAEPTGENSAEVVRTMFPGDPRYQFAGYDQAIRVVVRCLREVEDLPAPV